MKCPRTLGFPDTRRFFHCQPETLRFTPIVSKNLFSEAFFPNWEAGTRFSGGFDLFSQHAGSLARAAQGTALYLFQSLRFFFPVAGTVYAGRVRALQTVPCAAAVIP